METIANIVGSLTGAWKKVAALLPLVAGAGSVLVGAGGILLEISHAANAGAILAILKGLPSDPNTAIVIGGLTALGIHTNHSSNAAAIRSQARPDNS